MTRFDRYIKQAIKKGASKAKLIDPGKVVVANWVKLKCQYGCSGYNQRYTCPPYSPTAEFTKKMLAEYSKGLLIQIENIKPSSELKNARRLKKMVADLERTIFLDGYYKAFGMASGPCRFCRICDLTRPCKFPDWARPAMEACGIDVYQTVRNCGFKLEVVKTLKSACTYTALILIE